MLEIKRHSPAYRGGTVMTRPEELLRRALLHDQAAELLRQDVSRHESEAKRLREEAARMEEPEP